MQKTNITSISHLPHVLVPEIARVAFVFLKNLHKKVFILSPRAKAFERELLRIFDFDPEFYQIANLDQNLDHHLQIFFEVKSEVPFTL